MAFDPDKHHRRSIRLKGYDYGMSGAYFVTIATQDRECFFGEIVNDEMRQNDVGRMIEKWWIEINRKFPNVQTDEHVVMPNHFHGIIVIVNASQPVGADLCVRPDEPGAHAGAPLHSIVQWFKTMTTNEYIRGVKQSGWAPFHGRLWQRNYYEHIIRDAESLNHIRQYIVDNPARWTFDRENPAVVTPEPEDAWRI